MLAVGDSCDRRHLGGLETRNLLLPYAMAGLAKESIDVAQALEVENNWTCRLVKV